MNISRVFTSIALFFCAILISSCANYALKLSNSAANWQATAPEQNQNIKHTMFLIGNAGGTKHDQGHSTLDLFKKKLAAAGEESTVVFLGDNLNDSGMPQKSLMDEREKAEHRIEHQMEIVSGFKGNVYFVAGDKDWKLGLKGIKRQEKYVEKNMNKGIEDEDDWENYFLPDRGCGDPQVIEVNDQLVLVIIDSGWFMKDWDNIPNINAECGVKNLQQFRIDFETALRKNRNKNVVVAMHHPLYSYGIYGGKFTAKEHFFPLSMLNEKAMLPLPVVGTLATFLRGQIGAPQDLAYNKYREFISILTGAAKKNGEFIFASAHEKSLQYIRKDNQHQIVSGAGSDLSGTVLGNGAEFAYSKHGFAQLDFYEDGSTWLSFWAVEEGNPEGKLVYKQKIKGELAISEKNIPPTFPEFEERNRTKTTHAITSDLKPKGAVHYALLGSHFRELYLEQFEFPVLDLTEYRGGVFPVKRGGGGQTNSLRLQHPNGKQYAMRALTKDASRLLPYPFNKLSFAEGVVIDNFLSTHPFAASAIPVLADAANIYHTNPELYYVPKQPALGVQNDMFGGEVYLIEERPNKDWSDLASFGNSKKIISTPDMIEKIQKNHDHIIDERWVIRSRIFDLLIGDWDRHDDQWRWASFPHPTMEGKKLYRPIPRDRDQPFSKYDGLLMKVTSVFPDGFLRQLQAYSPTVKDIRWPTNSARYFDPTFMQELTWEVWEAEAKFLQENITEATIDEALADWPDKAQELTGASIKKIFLERKDNLVDIARMHYLNLAENVDVVGTDKRELFEIDRMENYLTRVRIFDINKKGDKQEQVYERIFDSRETKEIHIYGNDGDDIFRLEGEVDYSSLVRIIGCLGDDEIYDNSKVKGPSKKTKFYDTVKGNKLQLGTEGKDLTRNRAAEHLYNRKAYHYDNNLFFPLPQIGFDRDNGFMVGATLDWTVYTFKKAPYGQRHLLNVNYAFEMQSGLFDYSGTYINALGKWDGVLNAYISGGRNAFNYFGLGNESENPVEDFDFNRVRQQLIRFNPQAQRRFAANSGRFSIGPVWSYSRLSETADRFITSENAGVPDEAFNSKRFYGVNVGLNFENIDNVLKTNRGIKFNLGYEFLANPFDERQTQLATASLALYFPFDVQKRVVFATNIGSDIALGEPEFWQLPTIGGETNHLRGFRIDRFRGDATFYHSSDLRIQIANSENQTLPFSFGIFGGFDYGRVWLDGEDSNKWHTGYGGGIWMAPVDFVVIAAGLFHSNEMDRISFQFGFPF